MYTAVVCGTHSVRISWLDHSTLGPVWQYCIDLSMNLQTTFAHLSGAAQGTVTSHDRRHGDKVCADLSAAASTNEKY